MTQTQLYLNHPDYQEPLPVALDLTAVGNQAALEIVTDQGILTLVGDRRLFLKELHRLAGQARTGPTQVLEITPAQVVAYFEASPILRQYAGDVKSAILSGSEASQSDLQLEQDLEAIAHLGQPTKADISEELTGSRYYGGGQYKRIKAAYDAFYSSSTGRMARSGPEEEEWAA